MLIRQILGVLLSGLALFSADRAAAHAGGRITLVTKGTNEPVVAVDPRRPGTIIAGTNLNLSISHGGQYSVAYYTSHDRGRSFHAGVVPMPRPFDSGADPSIAFAKNGTAYYSFLATTESYCGGAPGNSAVMVSTSRNGGDSFGLPVKVDVSTFDDKPYMAVESIPGRPAHLFVAWTRFSHGTEIWSSRSLDGGASFSPPALLYGSSQYNFGAIPVVAPHHRVYVIWSSTQAAGLSSPGTGDLFLSASSDDGARFHLARRLAGPIPTLPRMIAPGLLRLLTIPAVAAARDGRLYVAWAATRRDLGGGLVEADILLSSSGDHGRTWTVPERVNDATIADRFMPSLSTFRDGSVGVTFYDRRQGYLDVYAAHATFEGGFRVSRNIRVNRLRARASDLYLPPRKQSACYSPGRFFGDYMGTSAVGKRGLYAIWTDTGLHVYGETDVWLSRVTLPKL